MHLTYEERSMQYHRTEIASLRRQLRPAIILTAGERLDTERRLAENEEWLERWKERASRIPTIR